MDAYCIKIFLDDRDLDLKPWQTDENDHRITEEDKIILREMWRIWSAEQDRQNPDNRIKKGKVQRLNKDEEIKRKLASLGYGMVKKKRK